MCNGAFTVRARRIRIVDAMRLAAMIVILGEMSEPRDRAGAPREKKPQREIQQTTENQQPATRLRAREARS
jgi:hypothetical protein